LLLNLKPNLILADTEDVLAPALFRGGGRGTRTEGVIPPCWQHNTKLQCGSVSVLADRKHI